MTVKRADLEDLQEAQQEEQEQAAAVTETDMTPMTTRPHQMPGNAEEETKYDPGAGHPAAGESNEPAIEQPEDEDDDDEEGDMPDFLDDDKDTDSGDSSDFTGSGGDSSEAALVPVICHACTRKFAVNQIKLGLRCICGADDLDVDDPWFICSNIRCNKEFPYGYNSEFCDRCGSPIEDIDDDDYFEAVKVALDVEAPNAEIPAPGGAVGDIAVPTIMEPTSSDEPRADELPENQQFAEPFTDEEAVEAKMALMAREVFKSQLVTPKQALLIAQKVLASYPLVRVAVTVEVTPQEASGPGALDGFAINCSECGFVGAYSMKTLADQYAQDHREYMHK